MSEILSQDEIDELTSHFHNGTNIGINLSVNKGPISQKSYDAPLMRQYELQFPIMYYGETQPKMFNNVTIYEKWNSQNNTWEFHSKKEKLFYINGVPVS